MGRLKANNAREIDNFISLTRRKKEYGKDRPAIENLDGGDLHKPEPSLRQEAMREYRNEMLGYDPVARFDHAEFVHSYPFWRLKMIPMGLRLVAAEYGALLEKRSLDGVVGVAQLQERVDSGGPKLIAAAGRDRFAALRAANEAINAVPVALSPKSKASKGRKPIKSEYLMVALTMQGLSISQILEDHGWSAKKNSPALIFSFYQCSKRVGLSWGRSLLSLGVDPSKESA